MAAAIAHKERAAVAPIITIRPRVVVEIQTVGLRPERTTTVHAVRVLRHQAVDRIQQVRRLLQVVRIQLHLRAVQPEAAVRLHPHAVIHRRTVAAIAVPHVRQVHIHLRLPVHLLQVQVLRAVRLLPLRVAAVEVQALRADRADN